MAPLWVGKSYKLVKSENFEELGKAIGIGFAMRKIGNTMSPTVTLTVDSDGLYTLVTASTIKTTTIKFQPGVEFQEETVDGRTVQTVCNFENENRLIQIHKGEKPTEIIREFTATDLKITITFQNITALRYFEVLE